FSDFILWRKQAAMDIHFVDAATVCAYPHFLIPAEIQVHNALRGQSVLGVIPYIPAVVRIVSGDSPIVCQPKMSVDRGCYGGWVVFPFPFYFNCFCLVVVVTDADILNNQPQTAIGSFCHAADVVMVQGFLF